MIYEMNPLINKDRVVALPPTRLHPRSPSLLSTLFLHPAETLRRHHTPNTL